MANHEFQELRKLLAQKRNPNPGSEYFSGVLVEFHRRQRMELLQPKLTWAGRCNVLWENFVESLTLEPARALRYACAMAFSAGLLSLSLNGGWMGGNTSVASLAAPSGAPVVYAFEQPADRGLLVSASQADEVIVGDSLAFDSKSRYAMSESPAMYDSALAF
jgi:hypothetical protein